MWLSCKKTKELTSENQLDHQLHAQGGQERGQQDDPEGAEALPAADQRGGGRHLRRRHLQGEFKTNNQNNKDEHQPIAT